MPCISGKWSKAKLPAKLNIRNYWRFFMGQWAEGDNLAHSFPMQRKGKHGRV